MAKAKKAEIVVVESGGAGIVVEAIPTLIAHLSVDYGREDINNIARKINEIIDRFNEKGTAQETTQEQG